MSTVK
jgi:hypothetical protein